jgi:glycine/D-amino acid oxidase-like deaminating enzyme
MTDSGLPSEIGTLVIGGGIVGLCLSLFLAQDGADVLCLDHGQQAGSTANAGSLHVQMQSRFVRLYPDLVPAFERALPLYTLAVSHWQRLANELGEDIELKLTGGLMVAESAEQYDFLASKCRREQGLGLKVDMLDRNALQRIAPYLGPAIVGAEICYDEGKLNPLLANAAVRKRALAAGVVLRSEVEVTRLERVGTGFRAETSQGPVVAGRVVIAAGARSGELAACLSVRVPSAAEPLHMNITEPTEPLILHLVQHADRMITLKQLAAGQVVIGGGWPARLSDGQPTVEMASLIGNLSLAQHVVPQIAPLRLIRTWAGINTTVDGRPVLGEAPGTPGLFFAIPGDAGYTLGPLCARLAADAILGQPEVSIAEYGVDRFAAL